MKKQQDVDSDFSLTKEWAFSKRYLLRRGFYTSKENFMSSQQGEFVANVIFDRYEDFRTKPNKNGKTFEQIRVVGKATSGKSAGQEWSCAFFKNNKEAADVIRQLDQGDIINVTMNKNGNFWNPTAIEKVSSSQGSVTNQEQPTLNGGTPNGIDMTLSKRSLAIKLAIESLGPKPAKKSSVEYAMEMGELADLYVDYINEAGPFSMDSETNGIPGDEEVPEEED